MDTRAPKYGDTIEETSVEHLLTTSMRCPTCKRIVNYGTYNDVWIFSYRWNFMSKSLTFECGDLLPRHYDFIYRWIGEIQDYEISVREINPDWWQS